ncbi:MucB/RseB C-terminal domain-containing protein [Porticoccaceae bacterium]|jgi:sigma-E factor negative regulatory protein RseB|nr:MucB/RseB C-terminal domain-containing protein [Porticoccaceae bacterium]
MVSSLTVKSIKLAALLAAVLLHGPLFAGTMESAHDLMARMAKASRELNYQGLFTYEYRGNLTSVKVMHGVRDGQTFEHILHMDGAQREAVRRTDNVDCLRAGDMLLRGNAYRINNDNYARLEDFYEFHIKGDGRIANRQVTMVHVLPKDKHRYGYVVAIDKESGLLLQSVLMSHTGKPLERFQFVEIVVGASLSEMGFDEEAEDFAGVAVDQVDCLEANRQVTSSPSMWRAQWLPPGFVIASHRAADENGQESMMFTDGLAVFSVFIDPDKGRSLPSIDANLGATVAVLTKADINNQEYAICVVGEIPRATVNQIASAISLSP